ncbi:MAG: gamma-glutamyltransferase family protein [Actinomycetota bacterium]|nr:gamma-glutamyltransferase family protein [Actinomycetota bacterium]
MRERGVVAAGHPLTAAAGAEALRAGGNAVDATAAAILTAFVAEPLLAGLGCGGYLMVAPPEAPPVLLDFFVDAPGHGADGAERAPLRPVVVSFGDATQTFHVGAASCGTYGAPAGVAAAVDRFGTMPLAELTAPAARLARRGVVVNDMQAYLYSLLAGIVGSTPEAAARYLIDGRVPLAGDVVHDPELADALDRLGAEGAAPFYTGDIGRAVSDWVVRAGGTLTRDDLAGYRVAPREPVSVAYRGREVYTNPPPSAGGLLLALSLGLLDRTPGPPDERALVAAMRAAQEARTPEFLAGLAAAPSPAALGFGALGFGAQGFASRLGSTTHVSVLDAEGWACALTCTNGEGSGVRVPGTGMHVNNMMGEEDLSPLGFFTHRPGDRLPSMMAPTVVRSDGVAELVVGSAGSNRIRSALLQVIANVIDRSLPAQQAVDAPRLHFEDGTVYTEPGIDVAALGLPTVAFRAPNLFFGGCQAAERRPTGALSGGGDPRRGGAVVVA